jgi:hypothetical protein
MSLQQVFIFVNYLVLLFYNTYMILINNKLLLLYYLFKVHCYTDIFFKIKKNRLKVPIFYFSSILKPAIL